MTNDDLLAIAISKNDTKEIFLKVLSKEDFLVAEEQKVADGALATDSNAIMLDDYVIALPRITQQHSWPLCQLSWINQI